MSAVIDQSVEETTDSKALWRVIGIWRPHSARLIFGLVLSLLALLFGLALMARAGLRLGGAALGVIVVTSAALRWAGAGRVVLRYSERLFAHDAMFRALATLRVWFFRSLAQGAAAGLGFRRAGDLLSRLVSDIEALDGLYLRILLPLAGACITLPLMFMMLVRLDLALALAVAVLFVCAAFIAPRAAAQMSRAQSGAQHRALASLRIGVLDLAGGMREIRAFGAEGRMLARVQAEDAALLGRQRSLSRQMAVAGAFSQLCGQLAILLILAAMMGVGFPKLPPLAGIGLLFFTLAAFESIAGLTRAGLLAGGMGSAARRVVTVAEEQPASRKMARQLVAAPEGNAIRFEDVSFRWQPDRAPVFEGMSLDIPEGARIAVLGPSGVGKSSLAALLLKAAAPQGGRITLGGADIATLTDQSVRRKIAWLSQATHLFDDTIRANLLIGRPEATEEEIWRALDDAAVGEVVRGLPEGLDTWLGEGGLKVSGGQGRRIALARTLLADAPIMILDEPATGLDSRTEQEFLATLNTVTKGRTVLLIAHRLTGVERLDRIWRISGGKATMATA